MQRLQAFKFELRPDGEQVLQMRQFSGSCRFVFNKALALHQAECENHRAAFSYARLANLLPDWKREQPWLAKSPSQTLQQALKDLERSFQNFFAKRAAFPRFKKRGQSDSFRYPQGVKLDQPNARVFLPKLGWIRYRASRAVPGAIKNVTVSRTNDKWFVSIQTARDVDRPVHPSTSIVGIDVGIARFATFSDGQYMAPANSFQRHEARLRRYQRALSRKVKFSANWKKAKTKVQKIHARIARVRQNFLHQSSAAICKSHAIVVIEDLQVRNMSRSAKGTDDAPGKRVRQKAGLNRAILDQGGIPAPARVQAGLGRWTADGGSSAPHQLHLSGLWPRCQREPAQSGPFSVPGLRVRKPRRCRRRHQCPQSRHEDHRRAGHGRRFYRTGNRRPDRL